MKKIFNRKITKDIRQELRKNQTDPERVLWSKIKNKQMSGYKFFRQYGIGSYIADFYCPMLKVVIEIDGGQHYQEDHLEYDRQREEFLRGKGIRVIRFSNLDVLNNLEGVFDSIQSQLPPTPSLEKRGGVSV